MIYGIHEVAGLDIEPGSGHDLVVSCCSGTWSTRLTEADQRQLRDLLNEQLGEGQAAGG